MQNPFSMQGLPVTNRKLFSTAATSEALSIAFDKLRANFDALTTKIRSRGPQVAPALRFPHLSINTRSPNMLNELTEQRK